MKQAATEAFAKNMHHDHSTKTNAKTYLCNRECSVQKADYHIFPELKLKKIDLAISFVNTNLQEQRVEVLISEKEIS